MFNILIVSGNVFVENFYHKFNQTNVWNVTIIDSATFEANFNFEYFSKFHAVVYQLHYPLVPEQFTKIEHLRALFQGVLVLVDYYEYFKHKLFSEAIKVDLYYPLATGYTNLIYQIKFILFTKFRLEDKSLVYKDLEVNLATRCCKRAGVNISLRNREFELIVFFIRNPGKIFTVNQLLEAVWDFNSISKTNTVQSHISFLRKKIDFGFEEKLVHTVNCVGYKLE